MENKLQQLTQKLYDEGLEKGRAEAERLVAEAKTNAAKIVKEAEAQAAKILAEANTKAQDVEKNAMTEISLAGKQALSKIKAEISSMIIAKSTAPAVKAATLDPEFVKQMLLTVAKNWSGADSSKNQLKALLPEADFLGEEGDHTTLTRPWTFIVDPIDGTTNFVRRLHYSDISVALAQDGQTQYAVVYDPFADELFSAQKDGGAFCNGLPIRVSERDMAHAVFLCGSTIYDRTYTDRNFSILRRLYDRCLDYRRFASAALDCCQIAAGRAEIFFECRLSPWDYAAGTLIAQEAGATATRLDGGPMDPLHAGSVFITNGVCHSVLSELQQ